MSRGSMQGETSDAKLRKKRYYRHTTHQTETLEAVFQECHNPDEKKKQQLSQELGLALHQIKFWFQNRRTQAKVKNERSDNCKLRLENEKIRAENATLRDALKKSICASCGIQSLLIDPYYDEQKLRMENGRLKQQLLCVISGVPFIMPTPMHSTSSSSVNSPIGSFGIHASTVPSSIQLLDQFHHLINSDPGRGQIDNKPLALAADITAMPWWNSSSSFK